MNAITYGELREAVAGGGVALRSVLAMQPAGGRGDRVYPATYSADGGRTKYAVEGPSHDADDEYARVLLDSVASQANRLEQALENAWDAGELEFPVAFVDFRDYESVRDLDRITVLRAPHRIADALFRDSLLDGTLFRLSGVGRAITDARPDNATSMFRYAPTCLLFGVWDSTGPQGGRGSKFQRAIVSEIVGHDVKLAVKVSSRIDPAAIERDAAKIYEAKDPDHMWTLDPGKARIEKGEPRLFGPPKEKERGRPSLINHGNHPPNIDRQAGGVLVDHATQTLVLSLAALRKLRFTHDAAGSLLDGQRRREAEVAARTAVASLGVAAAALQVDNDYDLRSRCLLLPQGRPTLEILGRDGSTVGTYSLDGSTVGGLVAEAAEQAAKVGIGWHQDEIRLEPAPKLVRLIELSRELNFELEAE
uniref:CRISPR-associated protein (Cas_GSU0053) n=1 Tax=Mycobacterium riyadhense TaxID=486698 RepID=A0A653ERR5_9MYCO|nr:CRISPR-associated protein (Cas_GSU0053) [Mycobacterium riyadhense]